MLAALVVWLFLRRGGATMTIAVSMPVCILSVFVLMSVMDLTLNMMSLGGIAMGVGMIVDNSIVVLENINRFSDEMCIRDRLGRGNFGGSPWLTAPPKKESQNNNFNT